jgi:hypothetical protein
MGTPREDVREGSTVKEPRLQTNIVDFTLRLLLLRGVTVLYQFSRRLGNPKGAVEPVAKKNAKVDKNLFGTKSGLEMDIVQF